MRNYFALLLLLFNGLSYSQALQCYSGSQLAIMECPSMSCIKQTLGYDTVRGFHILWLAAFHFDLISICIQSIFLHLLLAQKLKRYRCWKYKLNRIFLHLFLWCHFCSTAKYYYNCKPLWVPCKFLLLYRHFLVTFTVHLLCFPPNGKQKYSFQRFHFP